MDFFNSSNFKTFQIRALLIFFLFFHFQRNTIEKISNLNASNLNYQIFET